METNTIQQDSTMRAEPQNEHQWLMKLVGDWTYEVEVTMGADRPPEKAVGTESVRSLGGLWILAEGQGDMPGCGAATTIITLGYNSETKRYTGTFVGSMMTHLWVYDGELDATQKVLILDSEGPAMSGEGKMAKYRDAIEFVSEDCWTMTSYILDDNGKWQGFMTAYYQRR